MSLLICAIKTNASFSVVLPKNTQLCRIRDKHNVRDSPQNKRPKLFKYLSDMKNKD